MSSNNLLASYDITSTIGDLDYQIDNIKLHDFVADYRAATPTAAAEIVVPNTFDLANDINDLKRLMQTNMTLAQINKYEAAQAEILADRIAAQLGSYRS